MMEWRLRTELQVDVDGPSRTIHPLPPAGEEFHRKRRHDPAAVACAAQTICSPLAFALLTAMFALPCADPAPNAWSSAL